MMKAFYPISAILIALLLIQSCGSQPENQDSSRENNSGTVNSDQNASTQNVGTTGNSTIPTSYAWENYSGLIIGEGVRARSGSGIQNEVISSFSTGDLVRILTSTEKREVLSKGGTCDEYGYQWFKVEEMNGKSSWVYGKFLFEIQSPNSESASPVSGQEISFAGKKLRFLSAYDHSYPPGDDEGLTGCDNLYLPFFMDVQEGKVMPIRLRGTAFEKEKDLGWKSGIFGNGELFLVSDSEGGSDEIQKLSMTERNGKMVPVLELNFYYQDGMSRGTLILDYVSGGIFVADYQNHGFE